MSTVHKVRPNVVTALFSDETGNVERHVVGLTLDEVAESFDLSLDGVESEFKTKATVTKAKRHRRTKAEMAAAKEAAAA